MADGTGDVNCEGRTRTCGLQGMNLVSYLCSTSPYGAVWYPVFLIDFRTTGTVLTL